LYCGVMQSLMHRGERERSEKRRKGGCNFFQASISAPPEEKTLLVKGRNAKNLQVNMTPDWKNKGKGTSQEHTMAPSPIGAERGKKWDSTYNVHKKRGSWTRLAVWFTCEGGERKGQKEEGRRREKNPSKLNVTRSRKKSQTNAKQVISPKTKTTNLIRTCYNKDTEPRRGRDDDLNTNFDLSGGKKIVVIVCHEIQGRGEKRRARDHAVAANLYNKGKEKGEARSAAQP